MLLLNYIAKRQQHLDILFQSLTYIYSIQVHSSTDTSPSRFVWNQNPLRPFLLRATADAQTYDSSESHHKRCAKRLKLSK